MGLFLKFGQMVSRYLNFSAPKNGFFLTRRRRNLHTRDGTKKIYEGFFCNFLEIKTHNFVKNHPKFENKSLFDAKFYEAW